MFSSYPPAPHTAAPHTAALPTNPGSPTAPAADGAPAQPGANRVLNLLRKLIDDGQDLVRTVQQRAAAGTLLTWHCGSAPRMSR